MQCRNGQGVNRQTGLCDDEVNPPVCTTTPLSAVTGCDEEDNNCNGLIGKNLFPVMSLIA